MIDLQVNNVNKAFCAISKNSELFRVREFIYNNALNAFDNNEKAEKLVLAVDEACANLIHHAFNFDESNNICIYTYIENKKFIVEIQDKGIPFNPLELEKVDMDEYFKKFKKGGLGVHLIKLLSDELEYFAKVNNESYNIFRIKMSIN